MKVKPFNMLAIVLSMLCVGSAEINRHDASRLARLWTMANATTDSNLSIQRSNIVTETLWSKLDQNQSQQISRPAIAGLTTESPKTWKPRAIPLNKYSSPYVVYSESVRRRMDLGSSSEDQFKPLSIPIKDISVNSISSYQRPNARQLDISYNIAETRTNIGKGEHLYYNEDESTFRKKEDSSIFEDIKDLVQGRKKGPHIKKKYLKYMLPLLLAYKLKFFTLIPVLKGGLLLLAGATGLAGFFFALFATVMGLKGGHH